ncbi:MAG: acetylornithine transaminase [Vampirovibrio sp.]|nr:acetylornithine transaminase [Vampirovibrio sp.]
MSDNVTTTKTEALIQRGKAVVMNTYSQVPIALQWGQGSTVWDMEGKKYLDFVAGIAVNALGHSNPDYIQNLTDQLHRIAHCSNLYWTEPQVQLAETLVNNSDLDKVFFCNSGTEAVEAALKLARKYGKKAHGSHRTDIIAMEGGFHGRTYGAVSATGQPKYQKDLDPLLPGISHVPYNDLEALRQHITPNTCAVLMEPIQGEGGIRPADVDYLKAVKALCAEHDIVLIFDEVQCGIGRTGHLFAYQHYGVNPDIITLAKGLGGGFPIGAMMATDKVADAFAPGDHAATFGGNPLASVAGISVLHDLLHNDLLAHVQTVGLHLIQHLTTLQEKFPVITDVRGIGLMQGIELSVPTAPIVTACRENGLLLVGAGADVIRFVPPLVVTKTEIDQAMKILEDVLTKTQQEQ